MKTNALPSPSWWHQPAPQITPLDALRVTADHLERGEAVPAPAARLVAAALRRYLAGDLDLVRSLGLRPRRGKRPPVEVERRDARDGHIRALYESQPGPNKTERARRVAALLSGDQPSQPITEADVLAHLDALQREHGGDLPRSADRILRLVRDGA